MPVLRKEGPYIWVTWLTKLLTGDDSCEHASWFKTQFDAKSWTKAERVTNLARWQVGHTDLKNAKAREFRAQGYQASPLYDSPQVRGHGTWGTMEYGRGRNRVET